MGTIDPTNRNIKYSTLIRAVNKQKGAVGENRAEWNGALDRAVGEESAEHRPPTLSWAECTWQGHVCSPTQRRAWSMAQHVCWGSTDGRVEEEGWCSFSSRDPALA